MTSEQIHTKTNLHTEPNDFIGRERDVTELRHLLAATRAVTLCGPGGIGKTRLAMRVARSLVEDFEDGVWLVELADAPAGGLGADSVTRRVGIALGAAEEGARPAIETLVDALGTRRALLVIDNCEHLIDECAALLRTLLSRCPRLLVLATSREPLRIPGENVWRVPPLSIPLSVSGAAAEEVLRHEGVRLFTARATEARPGFTVTDANATAIAELCRALDGVPLALELAAARVRVLSVEQIAQRLTDRFRLLSAGDRTAPPRQRTLRAAIDWSHELLDEPERMLLRRLSVFTGWTLDLAERVCADRRLPEDQILDLLTALVDKSLVVLDREVAKETRFRLLDSIRQYAAEGLTAAGEEAELRSRHRDTVLEVAEYDAEVALAGRKAPWSARVTLFRKYDYEMDNLRAALAWSLERDEVEEGLRLCTAMRAYCLPRGYFTECEEWTERFMSRGRSGVSRSVWGAMLVGRAELALEQRDFARAERYATEGLELCRAAGDEVMIAAGLAALAQAEVSTGRLDAASNRLEEAISVARAGEDQWNESIAFISKGTLLAVQGRLREAQGMFETSLRLAREIDQLWCAARALISLGQLARLRTDHAAARRYFEEALPILREISAGPDIARCLAWIGRCALELGDLGLARPALTESLTLSRATGVRLGVARGLESFSELLAQEGDARGAVLVGGAASAMRDAVGQAPTTGARLERTLEPIRRRLGEPLVAQLWGQGRMTSAEDAVAYALKAPEPGDVPAPREPGEAAAPARITPAAAPQTPPSTLTTREREIARMIARGLSNRGIADELVISPATVARHVTNILTKLGFGSRAQIAAWAVDNLTED